MSSLIIMIQDFIGSPNSAVKEKETEMKGGVWRRLSASPFGLTLGPKSPPSFILFIIKLIFSCPLIIYFLILI